MMTVNSACRDCGSKQLVRFLDLGVQPLANAFLKKEDIPNEKRYPLEAYVCADCQLVQLIHIVDIDELFQNYVYLTAGAGPTIPKHFSDYAEAVTKRFNLGSNAFIVEMGSNDGLLLDAFKKHGLRVLGVDPAKNVVAIANARGIPTIAKPWSEEVASEIISLHGRADVIIGNNVVAHINDHHGLVRGVKTLLKDRGVFIFEAPYLIDMFERLAFDTIYHEHLACLSLRPLKRMFESFGLEVFDMELIPAQGVSMRVFVGFPNQHEVSEHVAYFVRKEEEMGLDKVASYHALAKRIQERKKELVSLLTKLKKEGKRIAGYGAPAKGNTLLNYMQIGRETLDYLTEELGTKIDRLSPGMHVPVIHIDEARKNPPDYFLVLAWNYADAIMKNERGLRERGVRFIIPIGEKIEVLE